MIFGGQQREHVHLVKIRNEKDLFFSAMSEHLIATSPTT